MDASPRVCHDILELIGYYAHGLDSNCAVVYSANGPVDAPVCRHDGRTLWYRDMAIAHHFPDGRTWVRSVMPDLIDNGAATSIIEAVHAELYNANKEVINGPKISLFCRNCYLPLPEHAEGKCLYEASTFQRMIL